MTRPGCRACGRPPYAAWPAALPRPPQGPPPLHRAVHPHCNGLVREAGWAELADMRVLVLAGPRMRKLLQCQACRAPHPRWLRAAWVPHTLHACVPSSPPAHTAPISWLPARAKRPNHIGCTPRCTHTGTDPSIHPSICTAGGRGVLCSHHTGLPASVSTVAAALSSPMLLLLDALLHTLAPAARTATLLRRPTRWWWWCCLSEGRLAATPVRGRLLGPAAAWWGHANRPVCCWDSSMAAAGRPAARELPNCTHKASEAAFQRQQHARSLKSQG